MIVVSIDVGIKNLACCTFKIDETKNFTIIDWDVINICEDDKDKICCFSETGKCMSVAKFTFNNKNYCKKHAKNTHFFKRKSAFFKMFLLGRYRVGRSAI